MAEFESFFFSTWDDFPWNSIITCASATTAGTHNLTSTSTPASPSGSPCPYSNIVRRVYMGLPNVLLYVT